MKSWFVVDALETEVDMDNKGYDVLEPK